MKTPTWGWILLVIIIMFIMFTIPIPPLWILAICIMVVFRIPRFIWNWWYVNVLNKEKIKE